MTFRLDATDTTKNVKSAKNVNLKKKKKIFAMFRFFVGTADEKFKHFFIEVPGTFDEKMLFFFLHFPFSFATNKYFCELGKCWTWIWA